MLHFNRTWQTAGVVLLASGAAWSDNQRDAGERLEEVTIVGTREQARQLPGSAFVIDRDDLAIFRHSDINRILAEAPGVYMVEEDGFGLRPNIGIRGTGTERSGKITLMEDGVLIAPAPYSNPEAYYFPSAGRMVGVEVLKGPTLLREGPFTVGGAVNLLSTPIPREYGGQVNVEVGQFGENRIHANYGGSGDQYGWLLETFQHNGDGFKDIDRSSVNTGFRVQDYIGKFRINTPSSWSGRYQSLELKVQYSEEESNASYLGLTDRDFDDDANRRYGLTEQDQMNNRHTGVNLNYLIEVTQGLELQLLGYYNHFQRDWFKVDKIAGEGISSVIDDANTDPASAQNGWLQGDDVEGIDIKHNNREYTSKGVQLALDWRVATGSVDHRVDAGLRLHRDDMDRFQPVEVFDQQNGSLVFQRVKDPTGSNNREEEGKALALWALDTMSFGERVDLTLALRYEDIETERTEYGDVDRNEPVPAKARSNTTTEWLPGAGVTYQFTDSWQLLAGVHRGMAPAGAGANEDTDPELSTNYELGFRFSQGLLNAELIGFYSDYENALVNCSQANPCGNAGEITSGTQQLGEAEIKGLEATLGYTATSGSVSWPLRFSYTYTDAEITKDEGDLRKGDGYRYIPKNLFFARAGVVIPQGWDLFLSARFVDEMCVDFSCDRSGVDDTYLKTDALWVFDAVTRYQLTDSAQVYLKVDNLFDEQKIVSRSPAGARPNRPRSALLGLNLSF